MFKNWDFSGLLAPKTWFIFWDFTMKECEYNLVASVQMKDEVDFARSQISGG